MISAKEARDQVEAAKRVTTAYELHQFRKSLTAAVNEALAMKVCEAECEVPAVIDSDAIYGLKKELRSQGYRTSLRTETGVLAVGIVRMPKQFLKLYW